MTELQVDARGLACPQPVLKSREAISQPQISHVRVLVDDVSQVEDVVDMARNLGWTGKIVRQESDLVELLLTRGEVTAQPAGLEKAPIPDSTTNLVALVASDRLGSGDDELGGILMRAFLKTLREVTPRPRTLIFINGGVRLTTAGSELIPDIVKLAADGAEVLSCGTCLDFFKLKDKLEVGKVSNMLEIVSRLSAADHVLRP
jgi:selenium metabolism protein YedF